MRVAIVTPIFLGKDGVGRSTASKVRMLERHGHRVVIYTDRPDLATRDDLRDRLRLLLPRDALLQALEKRDDDFLSHDLYVYEYPLYYSLLETCWALAGKHLIFDCHCVTPPAFFRDDLERQFIHKSLRGLSVLAEGHGVLVHSRFAGDETAVAAGLPAELFRVLALPVEDAFFAPVAAGEAAASRERLGLRGGFTMLYVGRAAAHKGLFTLLSAAALVRRERPDARLLIVGDSATRGYDTERKLLERRARELGIFDSVTFSGQVSEADLRGAYLASDVFVTASEHEGFCLPVAEAMATGRPVVCSDAGALPETAGGAGLLFPVRDAAACSRQVLRVAADPSLAASLAQRGRERAAAFREETLARAYCDYFAGVLRSPPRGAAQGPPLLEMASRLRVDYVDRSRRPWLGPLVSALRYRVTWHLERFFVRPLQDNFQLFALTATAELKRLHDRMDRLTAEVATLRGQREGQGLDGWARLRRQSRQRNANHHVRMTALRRQGEAAGTATQADRVDETSYRALLEVVRSAQDGHRDRLDAGAVADGAGSLAVGAGAQGAEPTRQPSPTRLARVLELGAGGGRDFDLLSELADLVTGVELHFPAIAGTSRTTIANGFIEELPFRDGAFDLVVSRHVMEHTVSPALALAEVRRVLRPGGLVAAITPHYFPDLEPAHVSVLTHEEWRQCYEDAGFEVLAVHLPPGPLAECHLVGRRRGGPTGSAAGK